MFLQVDFAAAVIGQSYVANGVDVVRTRGFRCDCDVIVDEKFEGAAIFYFGEYKWKQAASVIAVYSC